ncbi:MAG: phosphotransferase [Pseudomonadales bacterium]
MNTDHSFPTQASDISVDYLSSALKASGFLPTGQIESIEYSLIGTGKMGDNARLSISYQNAPATAPSTVIAKLPAGDEQARAMAGAQGAYYNEVMFYRELAPLSPMKTPEIFTSELSEDRSSFLLLMEDMSPAEPGSQLVGESLEHAERALAEAAKLAASFYGKEELTNREYIMTAARDDGGEFGQALMVQYWPVFVDRFGHGLSPEAVAFGERYAANYAHFISRFQGPKTVAHGDYRSENILFSPTASTTVDWQTPCESSALTDAAYFLGGSVETANRRDWEQKLIEQYSEQLDANGVTISAQECWEQYREFSMHGLMITVLGACFSSADERGDRMFLAMIQRHLQQCLDLDAGEFLPA